MREKKASDESASSRALRLKLHFGTSCGRHLSVSCLSEAGHLARTTLVLYSQVLGPHQATFPLKWLEMFFHHLVKFDFCGSRT